MTHVADYSQSGYTRYLPTGEKVVVDHILDGLAYVRPIFIIQSTNYAGDDFEEHEEESSHLICVEAKQLSKDEPVVALGKEVTALRTQISDLNKQITAGKKELSDIRREEMDLLNEVRRRRAEQPCFDRIIKLINGETMIAMSVPSWKYRCDMPKRLDTSDAAVLQLIHRGDGKFGWVGRWKRDHDRFSGERDTHVVEFFETEEDAQAFVIALWDEVLANFAKTPKDTKFGHVGVTGKLIDYKTLTQWVKRFPFLAIPPSVEAERETYEGANKARLLEEAKARVAELEST